MQATIIKDLSNYRHGSRIGEEVEILRKGYGNKYWIITSDGKEQSWPGNYLQIKKDAVDQWVDELIEAERLGEK